MARRACKADVLICRRHLKCLPREQAVTFA